MSIDIAASAAPVGWLAVTVCVLGTALGGARPWGSDRQASPILGAAVLGDAEVLVAPSERKYEPPTQRFFKGNLHTHSLWSDGDAYPEVVVDWYKRHGYEFLVLSEHDGLAKRNRWMSLRTVSSRGGTGAHQRAVDRFGDAWMDTRERDGRPQVRLKTLTELQAWADEPGAFLLMPGEEITDQVGKRPVHVTALNIGDSIRPAGGKSPARAVSANLAAVHGQASRLGRHMTGVINHPNFGWGLAPRDLAQARRARLVEIFNGHPSTRQRGDERHVSVERAWDIANTVRLGELGGAPLYGVAVDDAHEYHGEPGAQPGRGWVMVQAPTLDAGALVQALDAGDFYASTGVELRSVRFDEETGTLSVEVRPRADARYVIEFIGSTKRAARERPVTRETEGVGVTLSTVPGTRARYVMTGEELYVRARVTSTLPPDNPSFAGQKRQAWTQPVRFERDGEGRLGDAVAGLVESAL